MIARCKLNYVKLPILIVLTNGGAIVRGDPRGLQRVTMADVGRLRMICPLLSGPISILEMATKEEWNGKEAQAGGDHQQAA
jgi:hypothetical protein